MMIDWLLQAGFRLRGSDLTVVIDPYLSDVCADVYGLHRRSPAPMTAAELTADVVCVSHWHEDHLDLPTVLSLLADGTELIAPPSCIARVKGVLTPQSGIDADLLHPITVGQTVAVGSGTVTAVPARHAVPGYLTEDAVGYVVALDEVRVYHSGDTEYDRQLLAAASAPLDVALLCVNGAGGNMNMLEAAALATQLQPRIGVPMHVGLWTDDGYGRDAELDPERFVRACAALAPDLTVALPDPDRPIEVLPH